MYINKLEDNIVRPNGAGTTLAAKAGGGILRLGHAKVLLTLSSSVTRVLIDYSIKFEANKESGFDENNSLFLLTPTSIGYSLKSE